MGDFIVCFLRGLFFVGWIAFVAAVIILFFKYFPQIALWTAGVLLIAAFGKMVE